MTSTAAHIKHQYWTDTERALILRKWNEKGMSASAIAKSVGSGITRNMVIGILHRMRQQGLVVERRSNTSHFKSNYPRKRKAIKRRAVASKPKRRTPLVTDAEIRRQRANEPSSCGKQLFDIGGTDCRWPIGDPGDRGFHFCAAPCDFEKPYCDKHAAIAFEPRVQRS